MATLHEIAAQLDELLAAGDLRAHVGLVGRPGAQVDPLADHAVNVAHRRHRP